MKTYLVTLRFKYPAWDELEGIPYTVVAHSKAEACGRARKLASNDGHTLARDRFTFTAEEVRERT